MRSEHDAKNGNVDEERAFVIARPEPEMLAK